MLVQKRGIKPRGRVIRIEAPGQFEFFYGSDVVARITKRFAEITSQCGAVWFESCGHEEIIQPGTAVPLPNPAQSTAKPGVAQRSVDGNCLVELSDSFRDFPPRSHQESFHRPGLRIARAQPQCFVRCGEGFVRMTETELQFRKSRTGKGKIR